MVRNKIIFRTKSKTGQLLEALSEPIFIDDDEPISHSTPHRHSHQSSDSLCTSLSPVLPSLSPVLPSLQQSSQLIGDQQNRENLRREIDVSYQESLRLDQEKDRERKAEEDEEERLKKVQMSRKTRVPPEVSLADDHVPISVRCLHGNVLISADVKCVRLDWEPGFTPRKF